MTRNRTDALQKRATSANSHKRTAARRTRKRADCFPPLRVRLPELFELPFVKPTKGRPLDETLFLDDVDYWAPETGGDYLDEEFRGSQHALLTAEFMARHWKDSHGHSTLLRIFDAIAAKGGLWPQNRDSKSDAASVALGFVSTIGDLMKQSAAAGIARRYALANAERFAAHLAGQPLRRHLKGERASIERHIAALRDFAHGQEGNSNV